MNLTSRLLKRIIKEELQALLTESVDMKAEDVVANWSVIEEESFGQWPFLINGKPMEADGYGPAAGSALISAAAEEDPELAQAIQKSIEAAGDVDGDEKKSYTLFQILAENPGGSAAIILDLFDFVKSITAYPSGELYLGDVGTRIELKYDPGPGIIEIVENPYDLNNDGSVNVQHGWGTDENYFKSDLGWDSRRFYGDGIITDFSEGSGGHGNQDIQSVFKLNIDNMLRLINDPNEEWVVEIDLESKKYNLRIMS